MPPTTQINIRRDTAANFTSANPTLALGEIAYETDTRNIKVGDGATAWTALGYINPFRGGTAAAPTSNTVLGSGAGAVMQSTASQNTIIGEFSGDAITTGSRNTAVGWAALSASTTAIDSTAVGRAALNNSTGANNTAVGSGAGQSVTSGTGGTFVGAFAGNLNTASDITAVGANALDANTTGARNTAIGKDALGANTTASDSTAVGHLALSQATTGQNCTAVGSNSLTLATGIRNTAVGSYALGSTTSGANNNALGDGAGFAATTTSDNVFIGYDAGRRISGGSNNTTPASSIYIGNNTLAPANGQSNQIVIGNAAVGNGSNTTTIGNSSTTETYLAGNVTVNGDDIYGATVVGGSRDNNRISFAGSNPACVLTSSTTNAVRMDVSSNAGRLGSTNATDVHLMTNGLNRVTFTQGTGNMTVNNGNVVMATAGTGIDFSATAHAGGMTSELLSDYEEGTWSPVYQPASGAFTTMTMDIQAATYVKVGRQVTVMAQIRTDEVTVGTASGTLRIGGLPFAIGQHRGAASIAGASSWSASGFPWTARTEQGTSYLFMYKRATSDGQDTESQVSDLVTGAVANQNWIWLTCTYFV